MYFDTATEQPTFATVKVGMVGRPRLVFVPLFAARVSPGTSASRRTRSYSRTRRPSTRTVSSQQPRSQQSSSTTNNPVHPANAPTARLSASRADDSRRPHAPEIVPALVNRNRELIVELCLVVGPVEPDLSALDMAPSQ